VAERVLTIRELNRATLARQLLLERRKLAPLVAIERLAGLQAQWPPSPYIGLWSRLVGFKRETLERAVRSGAVVKPTVMRGTLHLITTRDYPIFWTALRDMPTWYDETHLARAQQALTGALELAARGPVTHKEGLAYLEHEHGVVDDHERRRIFHALRRRAHLLHAPDSALWRGRPSAVFHLYPEPEPLDVLAARTELVRRYLGAFGPSTRADIADWSGLRVADFADALEALEPLRRFRDEDGRELLDLPRAPLPPADTPAPVRFLPKWDNTLLAHADRRRVLPEELRKTVIAKNGDVTQTFLVDGMVAGSWSYDKRGTVSIEPFAPLPRAVRRDVDAELTSLEAWLRS
jgi:Winged helix DNA-binding domain